MSAKTRKKPAIAAWNERLDAAVKAKFPDADCETSWSIFSMQWSTRWWRAGTEETKLPAAQARQVKAFVEGFMASEEAHS